MRSKNVNPSHTLQINSALTNTQNEHIIQLQQKSRHQGKKHTHLKNPCPTTQPQVNKNSQQYFTASSETQAQETKAHIHNASHVEDTLFHVLNINHKAPTYKHKSPSTSHTLSNHPSNHGCTNSYLSYHDACSATGVPSTNSTTFDISHLCTSYVNLTEFTFW